MLELNKTLAGAALWQFLSVQVRNTGQLVLAPSSLRNRPDLRTHPVAVLESKWGGEGMLPRLAYCEAPLQVARHPSAAPARQEQQARQASVQGGSGGEESAGLAEGADSDVFVGMVTCRGIQGDLLRVQCALEWRQGGMKIEVSDCDPVPDILKLVAPVLSLSANTWTLQLHLPSAPPPPHTLARASGEVHAHTAARQVAVTCRYAAQFVALCEALAARQQQDSQLSPEHSRRADARLGAGARLVLVPSCSVESSSVELAASCARRREVAQKVEEGVLPVAFGRRAPPPAFAGLSRRPPRRAPPPRRRRRYTAPSLARSRARARRRRRALRRARRRDPRRQARVGGVGRRPRARRGGLELRRRPPARCE